MHAKMSLGIDSSTTGVGGELTEVKVKVSGVSGGEPAREAATETSSKSNGGRGSETSKERAESVSTADMTWG